MTHPLHVAILGTRGVPAKYGGFETAVEEIGCRLADWGHRVTVYARNPGQTLTEYRGMRVINAPAVRTKTAETLSHTAITTLHSIRRERTDVALLMNAANAPLLPVFRRSGIPTVIHLDGLESRRAKWRGTGARYYRWAEKWATKWADRVISDSREIQRIINDKYGLESDFIPYGAEVISPVGGRLPEMNLVRRDYHLVVARFEPENHVLEAVHAYRVSDETRPLVVVGSSPYSHWYTRRVEEAAAGDSRIRLVGGIYDKELLDQLYANCRTYIHGHSVGGTNPSLLRAMGTGAPVLAFDCVFNREVLDDGGYFWASVSELTEYFDEIADSDEDDEVARQLNEFSRQGRDRIVTEYSWDAVARDYERVLLEVVQGKGR